MGPHSREASSFETQPPDPTLVDRVRLRLAGFTRETALVGQRVCWSGPGWALEGTVRDVSERTFEVDFAFGGWKRFAWGTAPNETTTAVLQQLGVY